METPTLSEAVAASATLPVTVAPDAGEVIETVGWWCRPGGHRHAHGRDRAVARRVIRGGGDRVATRRGARRVPGGRVGSGGVGEHEVAVDSELDAWRPRRCQRRWRPARRAGHVAPDAGAVIETVGSVVSAGAGTVTLTVETELLPAASNAVAVIVWVPTEALVASQVAA